MEYNSPRELALALINTQAKHTYYDRTVKLADDYLTLISGIGMERFLSQFVRREDAAMFAQRLALTKAITPAVANSIMKPFSKVSRNDKVKKKFDFKEEKKNAAVQTMIDRFYGDSVRKTRGLDYWLKTRFVELQFADPNAWIVTEWNTPKDASEIITPYPFEVGAREAVNFEYEGELLKWLFVQQEYTYQKINADEQLEQMKGFKYTLYETTKTIVMREVDKDTLVKMKYEFQPNEELVYAEKQGKYFIQTELDPRLGFTPAFRVGYARDIYTGGHTYVNPFHPAMCYFEKTIKSGSELDLTFSLHTFPQKLMYVERCEGDGETTCSQGYVTGTTRKCGACHGTGFKQIASSAQDAITLPMPEEGQPNYMKLDDIVKYISPDASIITLQKQYSDDLKKEAHMAVFNSTVFVQEQNQAEKTAYEVDTNMQSIYDTLEPYTEKVSEVWKELVYTFARLAGIEAPEDDRFTILHIYPSDLKLKTIGILLAELKIANESGAPSFLRNSINNEIAEIIFAGDVIEMKKYETKQLFYPFNGNTPEEISALMASQYVSRATKILYANYEAIFADILKEKPEFVNMNSHAKQWNILQEKLKEFIEEIDSQNPLPVMNFGTSDDPDTQDVEGDDPDMDTEEGDGNDTGE